MELKDLLYPLQRWWWLMVVATVIAAGASYLTVRQQPLTYRSRTTLMNRYEFCETFIHLKGRPISFARRPYLRPIYDSSARRVVLRCSRQVEKTTFICNMVTHAAVTIPGVHIVVVFPRHEQATVFAKSRLLPVISESPVISRVLLGERHRKPQITHMRFANKSEVYIRAAYHSADAGSALPASGPEPHGPGEFQPSTGLGTHPDHHRDGPRADDCLWRILELL